MTKDTTSYYAPKNADAVTAHFRLSGELMKRAQQAADDDRRTLSNWLALTVERALDEMKDKNA
jgi:predicted DNA-binding protein